MTRVRAETGVVHSDEALSSSRRVHGIRVSDVSVDPPEISLPFEMADSSTNPRLLRARAP